MEDIRAGFDVLVGQAHRKVIAVVIPHIGEWIDNNVGAVARGLSGAALGLGAGSGAENQRSHGEERGGKSYMKAHHEPAYRTAPRGDNKDRNCARVRSAPSDESKPGSALFSRSRLLFW